LVGFAAATRRVKRRVALPQSRKEPLSSPKVSAKPGAVAPAAHLVAIGTPNRQARKKGRFDPPGRHGERQ